MCDKNGKEEKASVHPMETLETVPTNSNVNEDCRVIVIDPFVPTLEITAISSLKSEDLSSTEQKPDKTEQSPPPPEKGLQCLFLK